MSQPCKSMSMRELYRQARHYTEVGIQGYNLIKKYEDPTAAIKSRQSLTNKIKIKQLKRGSYLDDQFYAKKDIPGVSTYNLLQKQKPKNKSKKHQSQKKTYLDQAIERSQKDHVPAPGYYNVLQMMGSKLIGSNTGLSKNGNTTSLHKKIKMTKITYLDNAQYQGSLTPGVGQYNIQRSIRSKTEQTASMSKIQRKPQFWRQYHLQKQKQKEQKIKNQGPGAGAYNPQPVEYKLLSQNKKQNRIKSQIKLARIKTERFKTQSKEQKIKKQLGPGKYNMINQWAPKQKNTKGILSIISKISPPSVYYH